DPGSNHNSVAPSGRDIFIGKYDGTLTPSSTSFYKWAFVMGGSGAEQLNSIAVDGSGYLYVAGYTQSTASWNANPGGTNNVASSGGDDMFIAKYDGTLAPSSTSFYKWAFTMGGTN